MPQSDQSTQSSDALGSSASTSGVAGTGSDNSQQRINDLMSKWQSEQATTTRLQTEVTRLQSLLATAVSTEADLRQQLQAAQTGQQQVVTDAEGRASAAESKVAELTAANATLAAENSRLKYIQANPDLAPYAAILPDTADTTTLEAAARTIRDARQTDRTQIQQQLGGAPRAGGQVGRIQPGKMSATDIDSYLRSAPPGEFESRLKTVQEQLSRK